MNNSSRISPFWDWNLVCAKFLAQGLISNTFSKTMCLSAITCASSSLLLSWSLSPGSLNFAIGTWPVGELGKVLGVGGKGRVFISPAFSLLGFSFGTSCILWLWPKLLSSGAPSHSQRSRSSWHCCPVRPRNSRGFSSHVASGAFFLLVPACSMCSTNFCQFLSMFLQIVPWLKSIFFS